MGQQQQQLQQQLRQLKKLQQRKKQQHLLPEVVALSEVAVPLVSMHRVQANSNQPSSFFFFQSLVVSSKKRDNMKSTQFSEIFGQFLGSYAAAGKAHPLIKENIIN